MSIASRINEMTEHLRNDWNSIDKLGLDITEENSNDNLDKNIENIAPVLDRFYNKSSDKTDLAKNGIVGRTSQESTTGKNLCYFSNFTEGGVNFNGSEINVGNTTGSVVYVGSNFNLQDDTSKSGKTYTIYACVNGTKQTGSVGTGLSIIFAKTGVPVAFQVGLASSEGSFNNRIYVGTITLGENEVFRNVSVVTNNAITANINVKVMIVEGSYTPQTIGDYEPYTNGASPNPDYLQPIKNLSGDVEYKVRGKNLFDKNNANILKGWFRDATDEMVLNSVSTDRIIAFEGKPNTTYTISKKTSNRFRVDLYNSLLSQDGTYTFNEPIIKNDTGTSITVTTTSTDYYIYIHVYQSNDGDFQAILNSIQIEYGNTPTDYEPYISESFPLSLKSKNLFDGIFRQGTHISTTATNRLASTNAMKSTKNEYYTFSTNLPNTFEYKIMNDTSNSLDTTVVDDTSYTSSGKVTVKCTTDGYLKLLIKKTDSSNLTLSDISGYKFQVEKGNQESSYTPYEPHYDIELCNISDYKDRIYSQNGKFYLEKKTGKKTENSFTHINIVTSTLADNLYGYACQIQGVSSYNELGAIISNIFVPKILGSQTDTTNPNNVRFNMGIARHTSAIQVVITIDKKYLDTGTTTEFGNFLNNNDFEYYCVLATPTTTEITQENYPTLYSQLLAIQEFLTKYKINKEFLLDYSSPEIEY